MTAPEDLTYGEIRNLIRKEFEHDIEHLEAEVERLRAESNAERIHDGDSPCAVCDHLMLEDQIARAEAAEKALAEERAKVARVEALADEWISREGWFDASVDTERHLIFDRAYAQAGKRLRAALSGGSDATGGDR